MHSNRILLILFFFILSSASLQAQSIIRVDSLLTSVSISEHSEWASDENNVWLNEGLENCLTLKGFQAYHRNSFVYKEFSGPVILKFALETKTLSKNEFVLELRNTEIDRVQLLIVDEFGNTWKSRIIGDVFPFSDRYFNYRTLAIPPTLKSNTRYTCYLALEKKNRIISSIIELYSKSEWERNATSTNLIYGLAFGFLIMVILISIALFIIIKRRLYIYYGLYITFMVLLLSSIHGYSYQFIIPNNPNFQQYLMLLVLYASLIFGNLYSFQFLDFRHHTHWVKPVRISLIIIYLLGIINTIFYLEFVEWIEKTLNLFFIATEVLNTLFLAGLSLWYIWKYKAEEAKVFLISFTFVGLSVFYTNMSFLKDSLTYIPIGHSLLFGLLIEMTILTLYMIVQYRNTENRRILAENQITREKMRNQQSFINGQDIERRKIAMDLHDNVGSSLLSLRLKIIENGSSASLKKELSKISQEIRDISRELMPVALEELDLTAATKALIQKNNSMSFHFKEISPTKGLPKESTVHLYRILQELIKNTYQHANAKHVYIQFVTDDIHFEMNYEDDGVGYDKSQKFAGIGMQSIATRVNLMNGTMDIESADGDGVLAIIKVPLQDHGFGDN